MNKLVAASLIGLALVGPTGDASAQECLSSRAGRQLIERGEILPFPEALRRAGIGHERLVGRPLLCRGGGGYVYQLRVLGPGGRVRGREISAR